jgi:DNA-binding SARP family transcriptional activator
MIRIKLFGPTVVEGNGVRRSAADLGGGKPRQILEMLALEPGTPVSKDLLAERLWEGQPPPSYIATLESYICVLRRRLDLGRGKTAALATTHSGYVLDPEQVEVDVAKAHALLADAPDGAAASPARVLQALELITGTLLINEPYATWANQEREAFAAQLSTACTQAARRASVQGDASTALRLARVAVHQSHFSEAAWQELMRALWRSGERSEALRAYADLRAGMLDELGVEPGAVSRRLYVAILRGSSLATARENDRHELHTLLRLLRQAFEAGADADDRSEPGLREVRRLLLASGV